MSEYIPGFLIIVIIVAFSAFVGWITGVGNGADALRDEAVTHHAAEYYLDSNNNRQWHWLNEPKTP